MGRALLQPAALCTCCITYPTRVSAAYPNRACDSCGARQQHALAPERVGRRSARSMGGGPAATAACTAGHATAGGGGPILPQVGTACSDTLSCGVTRSIVKQDSLDSGHVKQWHGHYISMCGCEGELRLRGRHTLWRVAGTIGPGAGLASGSWHASKHLPSVVSAAAPYLTRFVPCPRTLPGPGPGQSIGRGKNLATPQPRPKATGVQRRASTRSTFSVQATRAASWQQVMARQTRFKARGLSCQPGSLCRPSPQTGVTQVVAVWRCSRVLLLVLLLVVVLLLLLLLMVSRRWRP